MYNRYFWIKEGGKIVEIKEEERYDILLNKRGMVVTLEDIKDLIDIAEENIRICKQFGWNDILEDALREKEYWIKIKEKIQNQFGV